MIRKGAAAYGVRLINDEQRFDVGDHNSYVKAFVEFAVADPQLRESVEAVFSRRMQADC